MREGKREGERDGERDGEREGKRERNRERGERDWGERVREREERESETYTKCVWPRVVMHMKFCQDSLVATELLPLYC